MERLVRLGADYRLRTPSDGFTPLFSAISNDNPEILRRLATVIQEKDKISLKDAVTDVDARGWTPLHVAVEKRRFEAVKELLGLGADPFAVSTPLLGERFCEEMVGRRVSPIDLASHKGRDVLEKFECLMRESGKHETYMDEEGDVFWPASMGDEEKLPR